MPLATQQIIYQTMKIATKIEPNIAYLQHSLVVFHSCLPFLFLSDYMQSKIVIGFGNIFALYFLLMNCQLMV